MNSSMKPLLGWLVLGLNLVRLSAAYADPPSVGERVYVPRHNYHSIVEAVFPDGMVTMQHSITGEVLQYHESVLGRTSGTIAGMQVGDTVYAPRHDYHSRVETIFPDGIVGIRNSNTEDIYRFHHSELGRTTGTIHGIGVGDQVYGPGHSYPSKVEAIFKDGTVGIRNSNTNKIYRHLPGELGRTVAVALFALGLTGEFNQAEAKTSNPAISLGEVKSVSAAVGSGIASDKQVAGERSTVGQAK